jgi:hypothetical protein
MSEIQCRRQRLNTRSHQPLAHLFAAGSEKALCGFPKKSENALREWEVVVDPQPGDVCWRCVDRREQRER